MFTYYEGLVEYFPFMLISHLIFPLAPKLSPEAPTTCGILDVFKSFNLVFYTFLRT